MEGVLRGQGHRIKSYRNVCRAEVCINSISTMYRSPSQMAPLSVSNRSDVRKSRPGGH